MRDIQIGETLTHPPLHPYIDIWLACRRFGGGMGGMSLPQAGGYLDQDAELMLAFMLLDDLYKRLEDEDEKRKEALKNTPALYAPGRPGRPGRPGSPAGPASPTMPPIASAAAFQRPTIR